MSTRINKPLGHLIGKVQAIDKVAPFFKKCLYLVASKLSLEVVPFWKTQANSGDHSATMFLSVFVFFSCVQLGFRYLVMLWVYVVFVAFSWGETFFVAAAFLSVTSVRSTVFSNYG
jgi:hypothetical protein